MKLPGSCFSASAPQSNDYLPLAVWVEECRTPDPTRLRTLGQWVRHKVKLSAGEPAKLKIGVR